MGLVSLCKDHGLISNRLSSCNIRKEPQSCLEAILTRTGKCYCFRLKKLKLACLQRRGKNPLLTAAAMKWVLEGSPRASMECSAQGEGSRPKIRVSLFGI